MTEKTPYFRRITLEAIGGLTGILSQAVGSGTSTMLSHPKQQIANPEQKIPSKTSVILTGFWDDYSKKALVNVLNVNNRISALDLFTPRKSKYPIIKTVWSTVISSVSTAALTYPLVYIQQRHGITSFKETNDIIMQNIKEKSYLNLYHGFIPHTSFVVSSSIISNLLLRSYLLHTKNPTIIKSFSFGLATNVFTTSLLYPFKRLRNVLIAASEHKPNEYSEIIPVFKDIYKQKTLYQGLTNQLLVSAPQFALETVVISQIYAAQEKARIALIPPPVIPKPPVKKYTPGPRWW